MAPYAMRDSSLGNGYWHYNYIENAPVGAESRSSTPAILITFSSLVWA